MFSRLFAGFSLHFGDPVVNAELCTAGSPPRLAANGHFSVVFGGSAQKPRTKYYRHLLAFIFAVDEINSNPDILPNVTLGYVVFDSCGEVNKAIENVLWILSGSTRNVPNYSLWRKGQVTGLIVPCNCLCFQISYGATDPHLLNRHLYPSLFRTLPNDRVQAEAIVKLLRYFGWTWIGIIASDDDNGETQSRELKRMAALYGICIEFSVKTGPDKGKNQLETIESNKHILKKSTATIVLVCGAISSLLMYVTEYEGEVLHNKTFILPANFYAQRQAEVAVLLYNGSLAFTRPPKTMPRLQKYLETVSVSSRPNDLLLQEIKAMHLHCLSSNTQMNAKYTYFGIHLHKCSRDELLSDLFPQLTYNTYVFGTTYHVYKAVYAMAHSLHEMQLYESSLSLGKTLTSKHKLQQYLRRIHFMDPAGEVTSFNENGELPAVYTIVNYRRLPNGSNLMKLVGLYSASVPDRKQLLIDVSVIKWKYYSSEVPRSRCSEDCPPGHRQVSQESIHICCFGCASCSEGEISNRTDKGSCEKCPDDKWPNKRRDSCIYKSSEYLSFQSDPMALVLSVIPLLFSIGASIILCIFILFRDTPIVKANNRNLSFLLLVSIMLSFLCVFLFLGRPVDITCMLRQTSFGIIFSVAVSSLLAKTMMVCIAFKATKPGNTWRKWLGVTVPNSVVFICSFIMIIICVTWLSVSPPFQEMNTHSYPGKIIIQCNEGSVIAFYTVLGYMGFLAAVSFAVAFLARKLPDSFNEAKYITFSMLVFCNVWVTFIPAYMSVMGKNTVIVEVFAILASSAGILCCIFFPKCYIILIRPQLNTKRNLLKVTS
uniref:G-protein coupled receptors family 3 profile domain-containing protein n=1 Tax=Leptobrachium leishanense TaxID=445787 RepID=A0A8C5WCJ4_9ANUR